MFLLIFAIYFCFDFALLLGKFVVVFRLLNRILKQLPRYLSKELLIYEQISYFPELWIDLLAKIVNTTTKQPNRK